MSNVINAKISPIKRNKEKINFEFDRDQIYTINESIKRLSYELKMLEELKFNPKSKDIEKIAAIHYHTKKIRNILNYDLNYLIKIFDSKR
jgi:Fic family protein